MDFSIDMVTSKFKNPVFLLIAAGVGGFALYQMLNAKDTQTVAEAYDVGGENIIPVQGYTEEDIKNFTENIYYSLAETVGTGLEDLGVLIAENQKESNTNLQEVFKSEIGELIEDIENLSIVKETTKTTSTPKKTTTKKTSSNKKYVTVAKWTSGNVKWNSTLWGIAQHYGTTVANLMKLNPKIKDADLIYAGQKIRYK